MYNELIDMVQVWKLMGIWGKNPLKWPPKIKMGGALLNNVDCGNTFRSDHTASDFFFTHLYIMYYVFVL